MKQLPFKWIESVEGFIKKNPIQVHTTMDLDQGLTFLKGYTPSIKEYNEKPLGTVSIRHRLFKQGHLFCSCCGLEGKFFRIERNLKNGIDSVLVLHLYGYDQNGKAIILNHDHIIPQSLNGNDSLENAQIMCERCNCKKQNRIDVEEFNMLYATGRIKKMIKDNKTGYKPIRDAIARQQLADKKAAQRLKEYIATKQANNLETLQIATNLASLIQQYKQLMSKTVTL